MKQVGFRTSDDAADLFERMFLAAKAENEELTKGQFFEDLLNGKTIRFEISRPEDIEKIQHLEQNIEELKKHTIDTDVSNTYLRARELQIELADLLGIDSGEAKLIIAEVKATQQRAMMALQSGNMELEPGQFIVSFSETHSKLMSETVARLTEKYKKTITESDVLADMFIRYTVDQLNEWFYPFVINGNDFAKITGHTQKELQAWLIKK